MDFSTLPHRQVVLRIKTTNVRRRVCSFALRREASISPTNLSVFASTFLNVISQT
jgi:hypothetical protein